MNAAPIVQQGDLTDIQQSRQSDAGFEFVPPGQLAPSDRARDTGPLTISHVADYYQRFPGESLQFHTQVVVRQPLEDITVTVAVPANLSIDDYGAPDDVMLPELVEEQGMIHVIWQIPGRKEIGASYEFEVGVTVEHSAQLPLLESFAAVYVGLGRWGSAAARNDLSIQVKPKGNYLDYLPALYEQDELMGRFLMLFESFWTPIDGQLDAIWNYLDPRIAPAAQLPRLASWFDMHLDERWSEEKRRALLCSLVHLYRKRGTKEGLKTYLEIFSGCTVEIIEHRADNFELGQGARLGAGIALGKDNKPHTFTVKVFAPTASDHTTSDKEIDAGEVSVSGQEDERRRLIEKIIDAEKPAHTSYNLVIQPSTQHEL